MVDKTELMKETVSSAYEYMSNVLSGISLICTNISKGREDKALEMCIDLVDGLKWLIEVFVHCKPLFEEQQVEIDTAVFGNLFEQVAEALENKDYVLLGDILEYELLPVIETCRENTGELISKLGGINE